MLSKIGKATAAAVLACAVGFGEAASHGGTRLFSAVGRIAETIRGRSLPPEVRPAPEANANALLSVPRAATPTISPQPVQSASSPADANKPDDLQELARSIPGAVVVVNRWLVASMQLQGVQPATRGCAAIVKQDRYGIILFLAQDMPFSIFVAGSAKSGQIGAETKFSVSINGMPTEQFKWDQYLENGGLAGRIFVTGEQRPPIVQRLRVGKSMTVLKDREAWVIDLAGSDKAIAALYDCVRHL